jgi:hypothetical protein
MRSFPHRPVKTQWARLTKCLGHTPWIQADRKPDSDGFVRW